MFAHSAISETLLDICRRKLGRRSGKNCGQKRRRSWSRSHCNAALQSFHRCGLTCLCHNLNSKPPNRQFQTGNVAHRPCETKPQPLNVQPQSSALLQNLHRNRSRYGCSRSPPLARMRELIQGCSKQKRNLTPEIKLKR